MSTGKEDLELDDTDSSDVEEVVEPVIEVAKTNLAKRRTIDNLLEERRLKRQLADCDFDL